MFESKPFSEACENNKAPILDVLREHFTGDGTVLEIGSGTGQHAVFFAAGLPRLHWQPSDCRDNLDGIRLWLNEYPGSNLGAAMELDVQQRWPDAMFDGMFSANTVHIMDWSMVDQMFSGVGDHLRSGGAFCLYGPFNYGGDYTSDSNARFDQWLKQRDPNSGIRDFEALEELAQRNSLELVRDHAMPANNRTLVWRRN